MLRGSKDPHSDDIDDETRTLIPKLHVIFPNLSSRQKLVQEKQPREANFGPLAFYHSVVDPRLRRTPSTATKMMMMTTSRDEEAPLPEESVRLMSSNHGHDSIGSNKKLQQQGPTSAASHKSNHQQPPSQQSGIRMRRPVDHVRVLRARHGGPRAPQSSLMLRLTCLSVLTLVVLSGVGLVTYFETESTPKHSNYLPIAQSGSPPAAAPTGTTVDLEGVPNNGNNNNNVPRDTNKNNVLDVQSLDISGTAALKALMDDASMKEYQNQPPKHKVRYNPQGSAAVYTNPFDFESRQYTPWSPWTYQASNSNGIYDPTQPSLGYIQMPNLVHQQLVFCSQGDIFITTVSLDDDTNTLPMSTFHATKLTTTVGNVQDPRLHPTTQRYLAYTATYSGRRDLYLLDLQGSTGGALRLTYWPTSFGVSALIGWLDDHSLLFRALSNEVSLPDDRLYILHLDHLQIDDNHQRHLEEAPRETIPPTSSSSSSSPTTASPTTVPPTAGDSTHTSSTYKPSVLQIDPVPLSQAREAVRYLDCWYFVRYSQSSKTIRYVGGTAERLYRYCDGDTHTSRFWEQDNYKGTSKAPQLYTYTDLDKGVTKSYLFFLSDRARRPSNNNIAQDDDDDSWYPDRMNVWALPLPNDTNNDDDDDLLDSDPWIQITDTSCYFEGRVIQEYSVDPVTKHMVLRVGADLYTMKSDIIQDKLRTGNNARHGRRSSMRFLLQENAPNDQVQDFDVLEVEQNITESDGDDDLNFDDENLLVDDIEDWDQNTTDDEGAIDMASLAPSSNDVEIEPNDTTNITTTATNETNSTVLSANETEVSIESGSKIYYNYQSPAMEARLAENLEDHISGSSDELSHLPIVVHSDFHTQQERMIPVSLLSHLTSADVYDTTVGTTQFVMTLRGQLWVAPVVDDDDSSFKGAGRNLPDRKYRVAPGASMGGAVRILAVRHVPNPVEDDKSDRRLAVILATDPMTQTAEHAFYLIETQSSATPLFVDFDNLPKPFLGGHVSGGSTKEGGLGSVVPESMTVSPCGRRMAWTDKDGRILAMNLPQYQNLTDGSVAESTILPNQNEQGQPMMGDEVELSFSPGGRYLAVNHNARNQFMVISIVDLGDPEGEDKVSDIEVGRIVQATPDRFNSVSMYWGKSASDIHTFNRDIAMAQLLGGESPMDVATALFFLSDRDIKSDVRSPWGTRQPMPHFKKQTALYALPLYPTNSTEDSEGPFSGGGATELKVDAVLARKRALDAVKSATGSKATTSSSRRLVEKLHVLSGAFGLADDTFARKRAVSQRYLEESENAVHDGGANESSKFMYFASFPKDMDIDFGPTDDKQYTFARNAYRMPNIPEANYADIIIQTPEDGSFVLVAMQDDEAVLVLYRADPYPSDKFTSKSFSPIGRSLAQYGRSTSGDYFFLGFSPDGQFKIVPNSALEVAQMLADLELDENIVSASDLHLSVWPALEYRQLYDDAWRMLRDYFYDPDMTGIDWQGVHERFLPLVSRCSKREELDDVLVQMASELSALHVFVYGGEYDDPMHGSRLLAQANTVASLGAVLKRAPEWNGYQVMSIPQVDPDFSVIDGDNEIYSPLSDRTLRLSGQKGLEVGDVIVGINGESVMNVPDIHMLLRGMAGNSVRLEVLRLQSGETNGEDNGGEAVAESVITVPMKPSEADNLRYHAWEWKTRQLAEKLAQDNGFSVGYVHLQDMSGPEAEDAFARGFFPNYHKEAFILDVRHNRGGNIDSWVLDVLQRKAWMYWQSRDFDQDNGGLGWDEQFAFRGHLVVLLDEKTSSDGEGVSRGISELGLGRLIGTRTWGGGIWLASDNHLVDGGIATAPEIGTYNENFGWGLGIEQQGVEPDIEVDNDPHESYMGVDKQLETAIAELKKWLQAEPVVSLKPPAQKKDMTMGDRECNAR